MSAVLHHPGTAVVSAADPEVRPLLRGVLHLAVAFATPALLVWLILLAESPAAYVGAAIFGTTLILLYGTSAAYHNIRWGATPRAVVKRIDHSMIFVLIAGTYTPACLALSLGWGIPMLAVVWSLAGVGALVKTLWPSGPRWLSIALYLAVGWLALLPAAELAARFAAGPLLLLLAGGVLYSVGSLIYAARRPDPWPRVFGFHEVFHALVVAGTAVHFIAIGRYVLPA
jgi:hemolysin III